MLACEGSMCRPIEERKKKEHQAKTLPFVRLFLNKVSICVKGNIVCQLRDQRLATFCICQLAELGIQQPQSLSALQQALVDSFLKNYDQVETTVQYAYLRRWLLTSYCVNNQVTNFQV